MDDVIEPDKNFDFSQIQINTPRPLQGGTYVAKLHNNDNPIIVQAPKCFSKKGVKETGSKVYCDLLFTESNVEFIEWLSNLEERVREIIVENKDLWFASEVSIDDIEYAWNDCIKKKNKGYLLKTFIENKKKNKKKELVLQVFNDEEEEIDYTTINSSTELINILEIKELKFSSDNFQITIYLRQIMILKKKEYFKKCLIKINKPKKENNTTIERGNGNEKSVKIMEQFNEDIHLKEEDIKEDIKEDLGEDIKKKNGDGKKEELKGENGDGKEKIKEGIDKEDDYNREVDIDNLSHNEVEEEVTDQNDGQTNKNNESLVNNKNLDNFELLDITDTFNLDTEKEKLIIKKPNEVYKELYFKAKTKARRARNNALQAYLEAKNIKQRYLLDELVDSDSESESDYLNYSDE